MAENKPEKGSEKARQEERLARALRENLRRRKAQARGREQGDSDRTLEPRPKPDR